MSAVSHAVSQREPASNQRGAGWQRQIFFAVALALFVRTVWLLKSAWEFTTDDAYITLRYANHFAAGEGLLWNLGEAPVEGYSNFLYVVLGAGSIVAGIDPALALKSLGVLSFGATCFCIYFVARTWVSPLLALVPVALLSEYRGTIKWAVSGLETPSYQFFVVLSVLAVIYGLGYRPSQRKSLDSRWFVLGGISSFLCGLTRPEGPLIAAIIFLALVVERIRTQRNLGKDAGESERLQYLRKCAFVFVLSFFLPYAAYFVFRLGYFGRVFPNTYYCKTHFSGDEFKLVREYWDFAKVLLGVSLLVPVSRLDARNFLLWGVPLFYFLLLYGVDPIIGEHNRHFLAAHSLVVVAATVGLGNVIESVFGRSFGKYRDALVVITIILSSLPTMHRSTAAPLKRAAKAYRKRMQLRAKVGDWLESQTDSEDQLVVGDAGMIPFRTGARVIDAYCLNCAEWTGPDIANSTGRFVDWMFEQQPSFIVVHSYSGSRLKPRKEYGVFPAVVDDPRFAAEYELARVFRIKSGKFHYFVFRNKERAR